MSTSMIAADAINVAKKIKDSKKMASVVKSVNNIKNSKEIDSIKASVKKIKDSKEVENIKKAMKGKKPSTESKDKTVKTKEQAKSPVKESAKSPKKDSAKPSEEKCECDDADHDLSTYEKTVDALKDMNAKMKAKLSKWLKNDKEPTVKISPEALEQMKKSIQENKNKIKALQAKVGKLLM